MIAIEEIWQTIRKEISDAVFLEPELGTFYSKRILQHGTLCEALADLLATRLACEDMSQSDIRSLFNQALLKDTKIVESIAYDLKATRERDPAANCYSSAFLYFKGFQALQAYRISHWLWHQERYGLARYLQSRISEVFTVDIHPAAKIGKGILVDHATGIVIGETSVLYDNISIMQGVTLGGTGKVTGDRHPKIHSGVLLSTSAIVLGNVIVGEGARVAAGSVVLRDVAPHTTVAGIPAVKVGKPREDSPAETMSHEINASEDNSG
jgi:serine O-acetyltransferase